MKHYCRMCLEEIKNQDIFYHSQTTQCLQEWADNKNVHLRHCDENELLIDENEHKELIN
jgi:hypothetical protein